MWRLHTRLYISFIGLALTIVFSKIIGVDVVQGQQGLVYQYTWDSAVALGVVSLVLGGAAAFMFARWHAPKVLLGLVPAALAFLSFIEACDMATGELVVAPTELALPGYGLVFSDYHRLGFYDLRSVTFRTVPGATRGRWQRRAPYRVEFLKRDGALVIAPGSTLVDAAEKEILQALQSHQIPVRDGRDAD